MLHRYKPKFGWSDVTPRADYLNRRQIIAAGGASLGAGLVGAGAARASGGGAKLDYVESGFSTGEDPNSWEDITSYNNFYEFGLDKGDPKKKAHMMTTDPWAVEIDGLVDNPGTYDLADVLKGQQLEERIYRFRCVEAWSMVIPWIGFELAGLLDRVGVQPSAKYVAFETLMRPEEMPMQS